VGKRADGGPPAATPRRHRENARRHVADTFRLVTRDGGGYLSAAFPPVTARPK